jgi:hypothetical protein
MVYGLPFFVLEGNMDGQVNVDLTQMTIQQYAAIGVVIAAIIIVITVSIIVLRKMGGIGSLGPLKWKEKEDQSKSNEYLMNREKDLHDEECKAECRKATNKLRTRITNEFRKYKVCTMTRRAVAAAILLTRQYIS